MTYQAADDGGPGGGRRYRLLAEMLTSLIAGTMPDPGKAAVEAGREWGAYLTEQPPPYQRPGAGEAIEKLAAIMEELGFAPQAVADGSQYRLCLHQCPFREVAQRHQDVVCSLHLGLMQGALAQMRAPGHRGPAGAVRRAQPVHRPPDSPRRASPRQPIRRLSRLARLPQMRVGDLSVV